MLRCLLAYCCLSISFCAAAARAQEPASPEPKQEPTPEPAPTQTPAPAEGAPVAAPVTEPPAPPPPPAAAVPAAAPARPKPEQAQDHERAPDHELAEAPPGLFLRLAVGIGVALQTTGDVSKLRLPGSAQLDVGYGFTPDFAVLLRVGTWFSYDPFALHFLGAGIRYGVQPEGMFVNALLGASIRDLEFGFQGSEDETIQGLAVHLEVGERFRIADAVDYEIGAHFELGTPLFASDLKFTSIGIGPFLALRWQP
jgi:hypothetical protein